MQLVKMIMYLEGEDESTLLKRVLVLWHALVQHHLDIPCDGVRV